MGVEITDTVSASFQSMPVDRVHLTLHPDAIPAWRAWMRINRMARSGGLPAGDWRDLTALSEPLWVIRQSERLRGYQVFAGFTQLPLALAQDGFVRLLIFKSIEEDQIATLAWSSVLRLLSLMPEHGVGCGAMLDVCQEVPESLARMIWGRGSVTASALGGSLGVSADVVRHQQRVLHQSDSRSIFAQVLAHD